MPLQGQGENTARLSLENRIHRLEHDEEVPMDAMRIVREASVASGENLSTISKALGKKRGYINAIMTRGSYPRVDTYVRILDACGFGVYVMPREDAPDGAMQVTLNE